MILNNQSWEKHTVALCAYWACNRLLRQDHNHRYIAVDEDLFAICTDHIIDPDEIFETFPSRPVEPKPIFDDAGNRLHFSENEESITAEYEKLSLEPKEFVFMHEVDGDDFLYQEWLIDINEGSPHR